MRGSDEEAGVEIPALVQARLAHEKRAISFDNLPPTHAWILVTSLEAIERNTISTSSRRRFLCVYICFSLDTTLPGLLIDIVCLSYLADRLARCLSVQRWRWWSLTIYSVQLIDFIDKD